jgi:hypothetical protein
MDINGSVSADVLNAQFRQQREDVLAASARQRKTAVNIPGGNAPANPGGKPSGNGTYVRTGGKKD